MVCKIQVHQREAFLFNIKTQHDKWSFEQYTYL